jgi:RimJ/RimL family protein N-acetyltransferase
VLALGLSPLGLTDLEAISASAPDALPGCPNLLAVEALLKDVAGSTLALYQRTGAEAPWVSYLARTQNGSVVGVCSFAAPPIDGEVEIAYFTFPGHEGMGWASAMAAELVRIAQAHGARPVAHTLPEANPSTRILEKLGFTRTGVAHDDDAGEVWRWSLA